MQRYLTFFKVATLALLLALPQISSAASLDVSNENPSANLVLHAVPALAAGNTPAQPTPMAAHTASAVDGDPTEEPKPPFLSYIWNTYISPVAAARDVCSAVSDAATDAKAAWVRNLITPFREYTDVKTLVSKLLTSETAPRVPEAVARAREERAGRTLIRMRGLALGGLAVASIPGIMDATYEIFCKDSIRGTWEQPCAALEPHVSPFAAFLIRLSYHREAPICTPSRGDGLYEAIAMIQAQAFQDQALRNIEDILSHNDTASIYTLSCNDLLAHGIYASWCEDDSLEGAAPICTPSHGDVA